LALKVSEKKLAMSRKGDSATLAPFWTGEKTVTTPRCTAWRGLLEDPPK
jgi:uncharacterized beta-barrel protein YwiB (DUF1934 family)